MSGRLFAIMLLSAIPPAMGIAAEEVELAVVRAAGQDVAGHFFGQNPELTPGEPRPPPSFGVERLCFTFGMSRCLPFYPRGRLFFSDWRFEVFSPDGTWTLLLQDRFGPYHAIRTIRLRAYLEGATTPDEIIEDRASPASGFAPVLADAHWIGPHTFEFSSKGEQSRRIIHPLGADSPRQ
jgi:hypothetical protein